MMCSVNSLTFVNEKFINSSRKNDISVIVYLCSLLSKLTASSDDTIFVVVVYNGD